MASLTAEKPCYQVLHWEASICRPALSTHCTLRIDFLFIVLSPISNKRVDMQRNVFSGKDQSHWVLCPVWNFLTDAPPSTDAAVNGDMFAGIRFLQWFFPQTPPASLMIASPNLVVPPETGHRSVSLKFMKPTGLFLFIFLHFTKVLIGGGAALRHLVYA